MTQQEYDNLTQEEKTQHLLGNNQSNDEWLGDLELYSTYSTAQLRQLLRDSE